MSLSTEAPDWARGLNVAVTVCDREGIVVAMNEKAGVTFAKWGGCALVGKSLFGCHSEASVERIRELLRTGASNSYTIEKQGVKKLIHQTPWYEPGTRVVAGLVEFSIELPDAMPHFVRG